MPKRTIEAKKLSGLADGFYGVECPLTGTMHGVGESAEEALQRARANLHRKVQMDVSQLIFKLDTLAELSGTPANTQRALLKDTTRLGAIRRRNNRRAAKIT